MQPPIDPPNWLLVQLRGLLNPAQFAELTRRYQIHKRHYSLHRSVVRARERLASYRQNPLSRMATIQRQQAVLDRAEARLAAFRADNAAALAEDGTL